LSVDNLWLAMTAARNLGTLHDRDALPELLDTMGTLELGGAHEALHAALVALDDEPAVLAAVRGRLDAPEPEVRLAMAHELARWRVDEQRLADVALEDPDRDVRWHATRALRELPGDIALARFGESLTCRSAQALGWFEEPVGLAVLEPGLGAERGAALRIAAAVSILRLDPPADLANRARAAITDAATVLGDDEESREALAELRFVDRALFDRSAVVR
jgi:HEAT repeat protein